VSLYPLPEVAVEEESRLVGLARQGDKAALQALVEPWRRPLFGYIYRMVTQPQDAEDLLQDVLVRVIEGLAQYRGQGRFKSWLFGIATHVCLDHLRRKKRWSADAQLQAERRAEASQDEIEQIGALLAAPDFLFEIREHVAFCFACIGRTLPPDQQAALLLREVLGFSAEEAAALMNVSEPVFRHRLAAARASMIDSFEGLCQLINKTGVCYQCKGLRDFAPQAHRGAELVRIQVAPGVNVTPESLFEARLDIVRRADLENGTSRSLHDRFFRDLTSQQEGS